LGKPEAFILYLAGLVGDAHVVEAGAAGEVAFLGGGEPTASRTMPRPWLAVSCAHIAAAHASASFWGSGACGVVGGGINGP